MNPDIIPLVFYVASKVIHAPRWILLRSEGITINSSWIDEASGERNLSDKELAERSIQEAAAADAVLLYCEPGEVMKGGLVEAGAALAAGKEVRSIGDTSLLNRVFLSHPRWFTFATTEEAIRFRGKSGSR